MKRECAEAREMKEVVRKIESEMQREGEEMSSGPPLSFFVLLSLKGHLKVPKSFISFKGLLKAYNALF